ncbi:PH-interacting protein-like [Chenopodium quinoa]|uniref:PH-interacting protein-like n=1 Tax=Chenopodium quinoa TaxID=63459 RepID=UPI000B76F4C1|nr:PH-interacting protein-like [Chenopodium quinoa]XP_021730242.1 PH-interacting protein-like [Chenopodium quinoa]
MANPGIKGNMALEKHIPARNLTANVKPLSFPLKVREKAALADPETNTDLEADIDVDLREIYFLIMHFLSDGPCQRTCGQFWNELLENDLLPRRYHAWYSRSGIPSGDENDDGLSFPLSYNKLKERYAHIGKNHLIKLLRQLLLNKANPHGIVARNVPNAADVPTLLGAGSFSLLANDGIKGDNEIEPPPVFMRWPHMQADQVRGLRLREIGGGFARHHRAPSTRAACYTIVKPSTMVQKMQNVKKIRGHRDAVYCAVCDRSGRFVITGSDDRLVKIWSMETAYILASCRGHEGDITDLAVSSNNALVASASNDCIIRTWRLPDGQPISVLRGHTGAVTAIAFSPRPSAIYQLLSSADDGTCRLWDARYSQFKPRIYLPKPPDAGKSTAASSIAGEQNHQIFCCAFNANGTVFVTGSSDNLARVWNACKSTTDNSEQPISEMDVLSGHENDVNYVQFSGCAVTPRFSATDTTKEDSFPKFKNTWFSHDNIVTCSRDGSAIIWIPRSRKSHARAGRWTRAYHLKVPPPPMLPQPPRGGPRQRVQPTPRGVNMIVWSLDNRFVLAAIMDCRICVWNASDGSLVHSLTGHTESTYVLDVHPFNPRIAMSAGYDGKTIIWDIWEGKPIRIYDTGRFKLVDGKFSMDGTSIVLSDDVGQLYFLSTGQGESQMDAKYDQFFLGDYRPLIRDTNGNVIDQETQLPPYRRNMQDLLCDSSMIPYPDPYQSMYQRRRLGTLGIEWRPSSVQFSVGPDFSSGQDHMIPLPDFDVLIDPLPDFVDVMDWEPEVVVSDDTDSEFNVTDSFGGNGGHISSASSGDLECSEEDTDADCIHRDSVRRSRRRKKKRETEITTSSGRRVKRRNLDKCDGSTHRTDPSRKSRNGRKWSKKKSLKASRPQRAAARNALNLFSKIKGTTPDLDEVVYDSEGDTSDSESVLEYSNFEGEESDKFSPDERAKNLKGKEVMVDDSEGTSRSKVFPGTHESAGNRNKLVLKLPVRDPNRVLFAGNSIPTSGNQIELAGFSSSASGGPLEVGKDSTQQDMNYLHGSANLRRYDRLGWLGGLGNDAIKWGVVRARTCNRIKLKGASVLVASGSSSFNDNQNETDKELGADLKSVVERSDDNVKLQEIAQHNHEHLGNPNGLTDGNIIELSDFNRSLASNGVQDEVHMATGNGAPCSNSSDANNVSTLLSIAEKKAASDSNNTYEMKAIPNEGDEKNGTILVEQRSGAEELEEENPHIKDGLDGNGEQILDGDKANASSALLNSQASHSQKTDKMYSAVYRRSRSFKAVRTSSDSNVVHVGENTSNASCQSLNGSADTNGIMVNGINQAQSVELRDPVEEQLTRSVERSRRIEDSASNKVDRRPREEWGSSTTVGLRSTRNRRINFIRDASLTDRRKSSQSQRKLSWLMLSVPDCSRYIPQQGDEVAYMRQGHKEYISCNSSSVRGPWEYLKGEIRAVELCKVIELEYSVVPGSGDSCCKMTLEFIDPYSSVLGKKFKLTLPEVSDFPDFLVERTRYETAIERNWTKRDKCQVWWKNEGDGDGSWWEGRVHDVKAKSLDFPDSPWERYIIRYKSDPTEIHEHSPWELYDAGDTHWEQPHLDDHTTKILLSFIAKLVQSGNKAQDIYGVQKLQQVSGKSNFLNRFPVPLSLEVIQSRLENNYYRSLEAVNHDINVMLSNAESYFGKNAELSKKIRRLSEWFAKKLSSL